MQKYEELSRFKLGDMLAVYFINEDSQNVEWLVLPKEKAENLCLPQKMKSDSLIQLKIVGEDYPKGFITGKTMRNSESTRNLSYKKQLIEETEQSLVIKTYFEGNKSNLIIHKAFYDKNYRVIASSVIYQNNSEKTQMLEMLSSFSLSNLSPFGQINKPGNLFLNRYRSKWSMEGRLERNPIEYYQLEPSWKPSGVGLEKFGQSGSMPVKGYFPYICIEDVEESVSWAAKIVHPGSWQIEAYRIDEDLCVSGGIADADLGQWKKNVLPGERFETPVSYITTCLGGNNEAAQRITEYEDRALKQLGADTEELLPTQFNEFCTTWGEPSEASIRRDIAKVKDLGLDYYVIDAGWYAGENVGWEKNMGEWLPNEEQFPNGIKAAVDIIREAGLRPGIWFEIETVGRDSSFFEEIDFLLKRDGHPITVGDRRFWDMKNPWVRNHLTERVIHFLMEYGFEYLKIDYNEDFGVGSEGYESLGEANRQQLLASQEFIKEIHDAIPDLIIENCSSGGHRLEPSMTEITHLSSFSDAHESVCIPIVAANLHSLAQPKKMLIWAVLRKEDDEKRLYYSMVNILLGRACLSGDIHELDTASIQVIKDGLAFYEKAKPIIKNGFSYKYGEPVLSYRMPQGMQAVVRYGQDKTQVLVVCHSFMNGKNIRVPISMKDYELVESYGLSKGIKVNCENDLVVEFTENYQAVAFLLMKKN